MGFVSGTWRRYVASVLVALALTSGTTAIAEELPIFTDDEFNDLFTHATLENLAPVGAPPAITGSASVDARIREIGEARGYIRRPLPAGLVTTSADTRCNRSPSQPGRS